MKKLFILIAMSLMSLLGMVACGSNVGISEEEARQALVSDIMKESVDSVTPVVINYDQDYVVRNEPHIEKGIYVPIEEYNNDTSTLTIPKIRQMDLSEFEAMPEITSAESWRELAKGYTSTEDALVIFAINEIKEFAKDNKNGGSSVPIVWLSEDQHTVPNTSDVCLERLRYKIEILAWRYGYTTCGHVDLDEKRYSINFLDIPYLSPANTTNN